jgi:hypothetical protein
MDQPSMKKGVREKGSERVRKERWTRRIEG